MISDSSGTIKPVPLENNRPGKGFRTRRVATDQLDSWKHRLTPEQVRELQRVMSWLPLKAWSAADFVVADPTGRPGRSSEIQGGT